jgi:hypothetical protein
MEFDKNFTNVGTLTAGNGLLSLTGNSSQNLDFGSDDLHKLSINNWAGGVFTRAANVTNNVTFVDGDFTTTNTNLLTFDILATATDAGNTSHVNGPVAKNFNTTNQFNFPIGDGTSYNYAGLIQGSTSDVTYSAKYTNTPYTNLSVTGSSITKVSQLEYWEIARTSGSTDATVELSWDSDSEVGEVSSMRVGYFNGTTWADAGNVSPSGNTSSGNVKSSANWSIWGNQLFTLGTSNNVNNPLPIELIDFQAIKSSNEKGVNVFWTTATEINNDYFVIEKSQNGTNWIAIDSVDGAGNSTSVLSYEYLDNNPYSGVSYYRLRQVDYDKTYSYSTIKIVNFEGLEIVSIFPNPSLGNVNYIIKSSEAGTITIKIHDAIGKLVKTDKIEVNEGLNYFNNYIQGARGRYIISVIMNNGMYYHYDIIIMN